MPSSESLPGDVNLKEHRRRLFIERNLAHDAHFYNTNQIGNVDLCHEMLALIAQSAPLLHEELFAKVPEGSPLQNLISDFVMRITKHSKETRLHVNEVTKLTALCANHLVEKRLLTPDQGADLCLGAIIHDFGKLYIGRRILHSTTPSLPQPLKETISKHVDYSTIIAQWILPEGSAIRQVVETHHENLNGSGYPCRLTEAELPYIARILRVIDIFEASTAKRRYHTRVLTSEESIEMLNRMADKGNLDKTIVAELCPILKEFGDRGFDGFFRRAAATAREMGR